jgi:cytochrome P450
MLFVVTVFIGFYLLYVLRGLLLRGKNPPIIGYYLPIVGCTLQFLKDPIAFLHSVRKQHGNIFTLYIGGVNITLCTDTCTDKHTKLFYNSKEEYVSLYGAIGSFFSCVVPLDIHQLRVFDLGEVKKLKTAQHRILPNMQIYVQTMMDQINQFFDPNTPHLSFYNWNGNRSTSTDTVDLFQVLPPLIISINASCVIAKELAQPKYQSRFIAYQRAIEGTLDSVSLYLHKSIQWMSPQIRRSHQAFKDMAVLLRDILVDRAETEEEEKIDLLQLLGMDEFGDQLRDITFLNSIFDKPETCNRMYAITAKTFSLVYAGGTVSKSTAYCLIELLQRPDLLSRIKEEHEQSICDSEESTDNIIQTVNNMTYSDACINETLRRLTGPIVIRKVQKQIELEDGTTIPVGHLLGLSPYLLHHEEATYQNPLEFDPDRWSGLDTTPGRIFHAFGGGFHVCAGMKMAMMETKIILNKLLHDFVWELTEQVAPPDYTIVGIAKPKKVCMLRYNKLV